jgi:hypothetical protein
VEQTREVVFKDIPHRFKVTDAAPVTAYECDASINERLPSIRLFVVEIRGWFAREWDDFEKTLFFEKPAESENQNSLRSQDTENRIKEVSGRNGSQ